MGAKSLGIRGKLIGIFLAIKVIPLVLLAGVAWDAIQDMGASTIEESKSASAEMRQTIKEAGDLAVADSVRALDTKAREAIERLTTDIARDVARFLYDRDSEVLYASTIEPSATNYRNFLSTRKRHISTHENWVMSQSGTHWEPARTVLQDAPMRGAKVERNSKNFHYRHPEAVDFGQREPLYLEMTFVDLAGKEQVKVTASEFMNERKEDISQRENTYLKAESYFSALKQLKPGEIFVSDVIGGYQTTALIGPYTKARTQKANLAFEPEKSAYAGKENPVGQKFQAIVRWATPVVKDEKVVGYVTLALDHTHIMEFTDHEVPTDERYSTISDAASGNYAFMWDYKGRNISHPRDYFIVGYDPKTGEAAVPWLADDVYKDWQTSGLSFSDYEKQATWFKNPGESKPARELTKSGQLGLDCRFLNFAPQCAGWWNLTQEGGSGSFEIFWSGLWKLTTAAAIPYYTGQYGETKRGFGFVTIGANVDEFHRAANETKETLDRLIEEQEVKAQEQQQDLLDQITASIESTAKDLTLYTLVMVVLVIAIAIWMANVLSGRITTLIGSLRKIEGGDLQERAAVTSKDEMGELATSLNNMTFSLQKLIEENKEALMRAEASSRAKSEFLSTISHELRTPLNGIIGLSDLIQSEIHGKMQPVEYEQYVQEISNSGHHLLTLISDVLDVASIGAEGIQLSESPQNINDIVAGCINMIHPQTQAKQQNISFNRQHLPLCQVDPRRLTQVVMNLLSNANKFSDVGARIQLMTCRNIEGDVQICVKDNGKGMTSDQISMALTPFKQVEGSMSREQEGLGIGLPLAHHLVDLHQGRLEIKSEAGQGTEVEITLPASRIVNDQTG